MRDCDGWVVAGNEARCREGRHVVIGEARDDEYLADEVIFEGGRSAT